MKKKVGVLFIAFTISMQANDTTDMKFVYKLYKNEYYKEATIKLEEFLKEYPTSKLYDTALNLLGYNYYVLKEYEKAKRVYVRLKRSGFKNEAYYYLMKISLAKDKGNEAKIYVNEIEKSSELNQNGIYTIANYFYKKNEYIDAIKYFKLLLKGDGQYYKRALLNLGMVYYEQGEYTRASAILEEYILNKTKKDENIAQILYVIAYSNEMIEDFETALKYYKQIEENYQKSKYYEETIYNIVKIYKKTEETEKLRENIFKMINTKYEKIAFLILAEDEYNRGDYEKARKIYKKILDKKEDVNVRYKLILTLLNLKEDDLVLKEIIKLDKTKYENEYYYYSMYIYYKQKEYLEIISLQEKMEEDEITINEEYRDDVYLFIANSAKEIKDYEIAKQYYMEIEDIGSLKKLIEISIIQENEEDVDKYYTKYYTKYPKDLKFKRSIYMQTGNFFIEKENYSKAEQIYEKYLEKNIDDDVTNNLIIALLNQKKYKKMLDILNKKEDSLDNLYKKGIAYLELKQYKNASEIYFKIIEKPENAYTENAYKRLVTSLFTIKDYENVLKYTSEYLAKGYTKNENWMIDKKGQVYLKRSEYNNAENIYKRLIKTNEMRDYAIFMLGEIEYNRKNKEMALKFYENIVLNYPDSEYKKSSLYWIININYEKENYEKAIEYSKYFLKNYSNGEYISEIIYYLGNIYMKENKMDLALEEYKKIVNSNTSKGIKSNVLEKLIKIYYDQNKYTEASLWVEKLENQEYKLFWQAFILEKQGKEEEALKKYKEIVEDQNQGSKANYQIGSYYYRKQNFSAARNYLSKVLEFSVSENKDKALLKIALTYEEEGRYQTAITTLLRIKLLYEESELQDVVYLKLAENYEKNEEISKSIEIYIEAYNKYKGSKYYSVFTERLLQFYLKNEKNEEAKEYYTELIKIEVDRAKEYEKYFR